MKKQKERSKAASKVSTDDWTVLEEDDIEEFVGYDTLETKLELYVTEK